MQLDPSIILGVKPAQIESPVNQLAKVLQIQEMQQMGQQRSMQMQDAQRQRDQQNRLTSLLASAGDAQDLPEQLMRGGFIDQAGAISKSRADAAKSMADVDKTKAETEKAQFQNAKDKVELIWNVASGVKDQPSYTQALSILQANGIDIASTGAPAEYDPAFVENAKQQALTQAQRLEQVSRQKGYDLEVSKHKETQRHNKAQEGVAAGQLALSRQRLAFDQSQPRGVLDAERGLLVDPRTGEARPVTMGGNPVGTGFKPLTEGQAKANLFGSRMTEADKILTSLEGKYSPMAVNAKTNVEEWPIVGGALGYGANVAIGQNGQQVEQAQRDFINAVLRRESGAVIGPDEFRSAKKQYLPQPGDTKDVLEQKRKNRQLAIAGLEAEIPGGFRSVPTLNNPGGASKNAPAGFKIIGVK